MNLLRLCVSLVVVCTINLMYAQAQPVPRFENPEKMPGEVNSGAAEESLPLMSNDGSIMFFVRSFHPDNTGGVKGGHDIWYCRKNDDGTWTEASNDLGPLNSKGNNAVAGISEDGNTIYLVNTYERRNQTGVGLSKSTYEDGKWNTPVNEKVPGVNPVNEFYSFYVTPEEDIMFISMQDNFSKGKNDLYVVLKDEQGSWNVPVNLGDRINTAGDEISPYLSPDRQRLYFATDGRAGMGGYDIFYSDRQDEGWTNWSVPVNLSGVNSGDFDAYFSLYEDGTAFFCSSRNDTIANVFSTRLVVEEEEDDDDDVIADEDTTTDPKLGEDGVFEEDETIKVVGIDQKPLDPRSQIANNQALDNIYFDYDKYFLRAKSKEVLDVVVAELKKDAGLKVRLVGHCDDRGSQEYNLPLSKNRANAAKEYLETKGIAANRIEIAGKGKKQPAASNETEEGRQLNRRVEIYFRD